MVGEESAVVAHSRHPNLGKNQGFKGSLYCIAYSRPHWAICDLV